MTKETGDTLLQLLQERKCSLMSKVLHTFHLEDDFTDITLNIEQFVTILCGNSGQGKSYLADKIRAIQESELSIKKPKILVVNCFDLLQLIPHTECELIIVDRMEQYTRGDEVWQSMLQAPNKYYIICHRGNYKIPFNPEALANVVIKQEVDKLYFSLKY